MKKTLGIFALILTIFTSCEVEPIDPALLNNTNNNSGGNVQFIDDGLELEVTPVISNNGIIEIDLTVNNRIASLEKIVYQNQQN